MLRANNARVEWDKARKRWEVHIFVGAEVIKRPFAKSAAGTGEAVLREQAIQTAKDEGYDLDPAAIAILQPV